MRCRKNNQRTLKPQTTQSLPLLEPDAAGIDIHPTSVYVGVPKDRSSVTVRSFGTFTPDLTEVADWLTECKVRTVAMESTGVYWIPLFQMLEERGFQVLLVNARHIKNVPGRKSDVADAQWIQYLHAVGLLRASYRPPQEICRIRALIRHRSTLIRYAGSHVHHMQKALDQMNLHLHHVISDITGKTGMAILDAIMNGERSPTALSQLRDRRIKKSEAEIEKAMTGDYKEEHLFVLRQSLAAYRHYQQQIDECHEEIDRLIRALKPKSEIANTALTTSEPRPTRNWQKRVAKFDLREEIERILGTDLTKVPGIDVGTAEVVLSEAGPNMATAFPSASAFASWTQTCPRTSKSNGRDVIIKQKTGKPRLCTALRTAASSLHNSKSALGARFRRLKARLGTPKALTAMAHVLARIIYHLIKTGQQYDESVFATLENGYELKQIATMRRLAVKYGFTLSQSEPAPL